MVMSLRESELHSKTVSGSENVGELLKYNRVEIEFHAVLEEKMCTGFLLTSKNFFYLSALPFPLKVVI